ncbi:DIL domain-containing protein [Fomitopsis betulina]|nr:DIL domain-containing protein [Fomitopsis betulina]
MVASPAPPIDLGVEPDLQPLYPTPAQIAHLLSPYVGLSPQQKAELVSHCLMRACQFGDMLIMSHLLTDPNAHPFVDLAKREEDGLSLISTTILGFGSESEKDIEREECVRLLVSEGCDVTTPDQDGWTPLHYAALLATPTLVTFLLTHGASAFALTRRRLTALDIVTAHSTVPGREDVAFILQEAMRGEGWKGGRMEEQRRLVERRARRMGKRKTVQLDIEKALGISPRWWGEELSDPNFDFDVEDEDEAPDETVFTPLPDYNSMLVFSPVSLPDIFQSLITDFEPSLRNAEPANALYMLARFACINCDHNWLEDLILGACDAIEETFFNRADDPATLIFWLYNTTIWLHLMRCDKAVNETLEMLGSFTLIEEILNSDFVFIIRLAERRIDQLLDAALLDYTPLSKEFESVEFESEWSFLRTFGGGKKKAPVVNGAALKTGTPPKGGSRPPSPNPPMSTSPTNARGFASLRQTFARTRASSNAPLQSMFADPGASPPPPSPKDITSFITALHTLLTLSGVNPAIIIQLWSQVMYWTACETFNRVLTRKKYICRSRAVQISMNLSVLEEWIGEMQLPRGIGSHFAPVKDLLAWLQSLSSITEFPNLIATIQTLRNLNPLQMRRAVRDYRYEINEPRMTDECNQYLAQLQKDWERHRVKIGVEALRKEIGERERDREEGLSVSPSLNDVPIGDGRTSPAPSQETNTAQRNIDALFDRTWEKSAWEPARAPDPLGELLDSRYMLPLLFPSDPRMLGALPANRSSPDEAKRHLSHDSTASQASFGARGALAWRLKSKKLRDVSVATLQWVDGSRAARRWTRPAEIEEEEEWEQLPPYPTADMHSPDALKVQVHFTPLTRKPSARSRGRASSAIEEEMPAPEVEEDVQEPV